MIASVQPLVHVAIGVVRVRCVGGALANAPLKITVHVGFNIAVEEASLWILPAASIF